MLTEIYVVVKYWDNRSPIGRQTLCGAYFTRDAAEREAERLQAKNGWWFEVVPFEGDLHSPCARILAELQQRFSRAAIMPQSSITVDMSHDSGEFPRPQAIQDPEPTHDGVFPRDIGYRPPSPAEAQDG